MKRLFLIMAVILAVCSGLEAEVLNFDDVTTEAEVMMVSPYPGTVLIWDNFMVLDAAGYIENPSGFGNCVVSGDYVVYNRYSGTAEVTADGGERFNFIGAYLGAAWRDGLEIAVRGYLGIELKYEQTVMVDSDGSTWFDFNYNLIDRLSFSSSGGDQNMEMMGSGAQFVMDDFTYIPEPGTMVLFSLSGLFLSRRRKVVTH